MLVVKSSLCSDRLFFHCCSSKKDADLVSGFLNSQCTRSMIYHGDLNGIIGLIPVIVCNDVVVKQNLFPYADVLTISPDGYFVTAVL